MADPISLSSAAQAVLDAFNREARPEPHHQREAIAAALRAVADQLLGVQWDGQIPADKPHRLGINWARDALHTLANELDSANHTSESDFNG